MKKIFLTVVVALCSLIAKGQGQYYSFTHSNYFLLPPCMASGNLPLIQPLRYDSACNYNITCKITALSPLLYNGIVSQVAQPYYTDTYVSIKGLATATVLMGYISCEKYMYIQKPIGNTIASLRYDTVFTGTDISSIELFFDSSTNIYIKDTFYIVIDVPEDIFYGSECVAMWSMTTSVINVPTGKNYCYCCEKMAPLVKYDNQWSHLTDYYFNLDTTTNCQPFIYMFPILDRPMANCEFTSTSINDTIDSTLTFITTLTEPGYPFPSKVGFVYDTILANLSLSNPNAVIYPYDTNQNIYSLTLPYSLLTCNKTYYYHSFVLTQSDTLFSGTHDFIIECTNDLQQIDLDNSCKIYPNPAKNELFIQSDFKVITLEIYNNLGVKVKEIELNRHEAKVDIANLPSGNYTLKLLTTQGEVKKKFVIK